MTITATHPPRRFEDICPPWCEGHYGTYLGWETDRDGRQYRDHAEVGADVASVCVLVRCTESEDHTVTTPNIMLLIDGGGPASSEYLDAAQARELAALLVVAAERAEAQR